MSKLSILLLLICIIGCTAIIESCQVEPEVIPDNCTDVTCQNNGICVDATCHCPDGFSGTHCEIEDPCHLANITGVWGYDDAGGPDCWQEVCGSDHDCGSIGQSPIDITGAVDITTLPPLSISSSSSNTKIVNNGHTIKFKQQPGSFITYGQTENGLFDDYTLGQFHFHGKSEHTIDGSQAPLEAHFVCRSIWADRYIVISVLFEEGDENPELAKFVANLPTSKDDAYNDENLSYSAFNLLPANKSYYSYRGSLTTPPCSELVNWIIMENKVSASAEQIAAFTNILGDNSRPTQAINNRVINHVIQ